MAHRSHVIASQQRDQRHQAYLKAPVLAEKYPDIEELGVEMRYRDPEGKLTPSPQRRVFMGDMRAHFDFLCPLKDCEQGGFELNAPIRRSLSDPRSSGSGQASCQGRRPRGGDKNRVCGLEMEYQAVISTKRRIAA